MTDETPTPKRPKRWLAFLLNLIVPPAGYVYAGMPRVAIGYVVVITVATVALMAWTIAVPPGVYGLGMGSGGWQAPCWRSDFWPPCTRQGGRGQGPR